MIAITGRRTTIAEELIRILPPGEVATFFSAVTKQAPPRADRYLFAAGLLRSLTAEEQSMEQAQEGMEVNLHSVTRAIDRIVETNTQARICVIGSESGFTGSHDGIYAEAKRLLHRYVETKALRSPAQQLVCIAPTIIRDAGMTTRRKDLPEVDNRAARHPKTRWLSSAEVASFVHFVLYQDVGYLSGVVIRFNGGAHTCA